MHLARNARSIFKGLTAVLAVLIASVASCTMVEDTLTGVSLNRSGASDCIHDCTESSGHQMRAEAAAHRAAIQRCRELSESDRRECLEEERARHHAAMEEINRGRHECMNGCHRQGEGSAG